MRNRKSLIIYLVLCLAMILTSIATTLALVKDEHKTSDATIKFDKVAIMGHEENGSNLELTLTSDYVGDGELVFNGSGEKDYLWIRPTNDTADMFLRFRVYFTLGSEELDEVNADTLALLNNGNGVPEGFKLYEDGSLDYELIPYDGWVYVCTVNDEIIEVENKILKVVQNTNENDRNYIISKEYRLDYDKENDEEAIFNMISLNDNQITLKVEAHAIQCFGLSNNIQGALEQTQNGNHLILDSNGQILEETYGNVVIAKYVEAVKENIEVTMEKTTLISAFDEMVGYRDMSKSTDVEIAEAIYNNAYSSNFSFLESTNVSKGGHASLVRSVISDMKFVGQDPIKTGLVKGEINKNYYKVDCGVEPGQIFAYWIKSTSTTYIENANRYTYSVIVYQEGGVVLNEDSRALFAWVGARKMVNFDMSSWDIDTSRVKSMAYMFGNFAHFTLLSFNLGNKFDTSNVTDMRYMLWGCGYSLVKTISLGSKFDTSNVTNMYRMFTYCGNREMTTLDLGDKFSTAKAENIEEIFANCGTVKMTSLNLSSILENRTSLKNYKQAFVGLGTTTCKITVKNTDIRNWIINNKSSLGNRTWMSNSYISIAS